MWWNPASAFLTGDEATSSLTSPSWNWRSRGREKRVEEETAPCGAVLSPLYCSQSLSPSVRWTERESKFIHFEKNLQLNFLIWTPLEVPWLARCPNFRGWKAYTWRSKRCPLYWSTCTLNSTIKVKTITLPPVAPESHRGPFPWQKCPPLPISCPQS